MNASKTSKTQPLARYTYTLENVDTGEVIAASRDEEQVRMVGEALVREFHATAADADYILYQRPLH